MSYEDTNCPCGGKKPTETMLCGDCLAAFAEHPAMRELNDARNSGSSRRHAATILLALARRRKCKS
jgi:hypothetical protein